MGFFTVRRLFQVTSARSLLRWSVMTAFLIFVLACLITTIPNLKTRRRVHAPSELSETRGSFSNAPSMRGVTYTAYRENQKLFTTMAGRVSLKDRRLENAIFASFKEIFIYPVRVMIGSDYRAKIMDWASNSNMFPLAVILVDKSLNPISMVGLRLVIQDLNIYAQSNHGETPWLALSANTMIKEAFSDKISFKGGFCLNSQTGERIVSDEVDWLIPQRAFYFPSGYLFDGERKEKGFFAFGKKGRSLDAETSVHSEESHHEPGLNVAHGTSRLPLGQSSLPSFVSLRKMRKDLKKMDRAALVGLLAQLMVLNPRIFKHTRISPLVLMNPRLHLGTLADSHIGEIVADTNRPSVSRQQIDPN